MYFANELIERNIDNYVLCANEVQAAMDKSGMSCFGIRVCDDDKSVGRYFRLSIDLDEYSDTYGKRLSGTSSIGIDASEYDSVEYMAKELKRAFELARIYIGSHIYLVGGIDSEYGSDNGEHIINTTEFGCRRRGAKVIFKFA